MIQEKEYTAKTLQEIHSHQIDPATMSEHTARIMRDIKKLGAVPYNMWLPETQVLPYIIHPNEQILGLVYGRYQQVEGDIVGRGVLVSSPERVLLIDKKPLFVKTAEISYRVISAVTYSKVLFMGNVTIHTRMGKINVRTFNQKCAYNLVEAIEANLFSNPIKLN
ncbi:MAG: PH domain-containing protein [bacterium]